MKAYPILALHEYPTKQDLDNPTLEDTHVVAQILACALNHRDVWISKGLYPGIRLGSVMGSDACVIYNGREYIVNPGLNWGQKATFQSSNFEVLGVPRDGTFAEMIAIEKNYLHPKPEHLSIVEAAALPLAGVTAYRALLKRASTTKNDKVLVTGIGGGVALFVMQFALALGCEVFVTSGSEEKIDKSIQMGAKSGYLYTNPDWFKKLQNDAGGIDVIIDGTCGSGFSDLLKICNPGARICIYGATAGKIESLNPHTIFWKQLSILGSTMGSDADFAEMVDFVSVHKIKPVIDSVFPFDSLDLGFKRMEERKQFGKIVFTLSKTT